ncbi:MAG: DUF3616 domain-containing protein [Sedimentitalea sp.]|uniref:DUF3616 domain-containing protein n=1 Tax=Sedimentitalea sp. TaxID=2048915 RepID=UPI003264A91C
MINFRITLRQRRITLKVLNCHMRIFMLITCLLGLVPLGVPRAFADQAPGQVSAELRYFGTCDGSAVVQIGEHVLLTANDEDNILRSYHLLGGKPLGQFDISLLAGVDSNEEIDIEGVARQGDLLWWIGSHGLGKKGIEGDDKPARRNIFATNIPGPGLENLKLVEKHTNLTDALRNSEDLKEILTPEVWNLAPKKGGLNIEGVVFAPNGDLLVGLRSPLFAKKGKKGRALIVHLRKAGDGWSVVDVSRLKLDDRGIRDIHTVDGGYLMIAGEVHSGGKSALYFWNGTDKPELRSVDGIQNLNPEAVIQFDGHQIIFSDDGTRDRKPDFFEAEQECGEFYDPEQSHPLVYFRAVVVNP